MEERRRLCPGFAGHFSPTFLFLSVPSSVHNVHNRRLTMLLVPCKQNEAVSRGSNDVTHRCTHHAYDRETQCQVQKRSLFISSLNRETSPSLREMAAVCYPASTSKISTSKNTLDSTKNVHATASVPRHPHNHSTSLPKRDSTLKNIHITASIVGHLHNHHNAPFCTKKNVSKVYPHPLTRAHTHTNKIPIMSICER